MEHHPVSDPVGSDEDAVRAQLGRPPRGEWRVARRCRCGLPQVIQTSPRLDDGTPFPTLYWLTCRELSRRVGQLEADGSMAALNLRLAQDDAMREALERSTASYVAQRDAIEVIDSPGHPGGGPDRVKCLHAHVGHELVTSDNPVGAAALEILDWSDPPEPCVRLEGAG